MKGSPFQLLWGSHFLSVLSSMVIAPLLPFYMEQLGAGEQGTVLLWSALSLAAPAVSSALTAPLWGRLGDRTSRKWMVIRALAASAGVLALMSFAHSPFQLFVLRLLQGALGGVVDAVGAYAASSAPKDAQGKVRGRLEGALAAGSMLGPVLGGVMLGLVSFRLLLILLGAGLGLWAVICAAVLKETRRSIDPDALPVRLTQSLCSMLRDRTVLVFLLAGALANFGIFGLLPVLPLHLKQYADAAQHTESWVGALQAILWAAVWLASSWWGRRNDLAPVHRNYAIAGCLCAAAVVAQAYVPSIAWFIPLRLLQGFASSALVQSVFLIVTRSSEGGELGARLGIARSLLFIGQIAGPMASGLCGSVFSTAAMFILHGVIILSGALLVGRLAGYGRGCSSKLIVPGQGYKDA